MQNFIGTLSLLCPCISKKFRIFSLQSQFEAHAVNLLITNVSPVQVLKYHFRITAFGVRLQYKAINFNDAVFHKRSVPKHSQHSGRADNDHRWHINRDWHSLSGGTKSKTIIILLLHKPSGGDNKCSRYLNIFIKRYYEQRTSSAMFISPYIIEHMESACSNEDF